MDISKNELDAVFESLRQNPDRMYVHPSGLVLIALADKETDQFMAIKARDGENFMHMTEAELNDHVVKTIEAL